MRRRAAAGYTIIEVLIVLTVTSALFFSVVILLNGRQAATEFTQALRDFESKIQSVASDVASGYYETGSYSCSLSGASIVLNPSAPAKGPGSNLGCVFMGKMFTNDRDKSNIFTLIGRQTRIGGGDVVTINEARPIAVYDPPIDITEEYSHRYNLEIRNIYIIGTTTSIGGFGFIHELGGGAGVGDAVTGSRGLLLYRLDGTSFPNINTKVVNTSLINATTDGSTNLREVPQGIKICFWDGTGGSKRGEITVGASGSQTSTFVSSGSGVSAECR